MPTAMATTDDDDVCSICLVGFHSGAGTPKQPPCGMSTTKFVYCNSRGPNCIDLSLSSSDIYQSVSLLKQACLDCGFFYVVNHGISEQFMDQVFAQSRSARRRFQGGPFYGPNVWPALDLLPGWRDTMEEFHRQALEVAKAVARLIALALDLDVHFFDTQEMLGEAIATLRLLHYDGQISDPANGIFGAGAHSDFGLITLLATDEVIGLQICKDKDAKPQVWEYVSPKKGAFIVNLGDMLERWSNCIFKSTLHRVVGNGQDRYSIAYFVEPSHDCLVECLPTCKSEENPPKFPPILCHTYLSQRYHDTHADLNVYKEPKK
ncbi:hypothetical protein M0R45_003411 [Rubus argutus]|uniref:Fe2OG dioxygenase domain-containing protein n=1 Tax=Rubus argutus TaxID=59490 RepID=A0AAW1YGB9_RUBAR